MIISSSVEDRAFTLANVEPAATPIEQLLRTCELDIYGHRGFVSETHNFFPHAPMPQGLPAQWSVWDEYVQQIPDWYRAGRVCKQLVDLPVLDPADLPDQYLVRANMVLGVLALGFKYSWQEMFESGQDASAALRRQITAAGDNVLDPIRRQIIEPWEAVWRRMGRHRSCVESDLFVANFVCATGAPYASNNITGDNAKLLVPFFATRTEHRFWFSVVEICSRFPGVSAPLELQRAMRAHDHARVAAELVRLAQLWQSIVEDVLASADTRVSAIEWGNTTARWTAAMSEGEEGFSGLFSPAWHVMDQLIGRTKYDSFLGQIMIRTRAMLPPAWQQLVAAVGEMPVSEYVAEHRAECAQLDEAYHFLCQSYGYFFQSHHRKVFAYSYQAILSGRERSNGGIEGTAATPGWELANRHLRVSANERLSGPRRNHLPFEVSPTCHGNAQLLALPSRDLGWLPGDRAEIAVERDDGTSVSVLANFVSEDRENGRTFFWLPDPIEVGRVRSVERRPSAFCRPPKRPAPVVVFADLSCVGIALAIARHEYASTPAIFLEGAEIPRDLLPMVNLGTTIQPHRDLSVVLPREARDLQRLLDCGAHVYVLGGTAFVRRIHAALRHAIGLHSALVDDTMRRLREERRLNFCVQVDSSPVVPNARFYPWDIATATDPRRRVRVICKSKVLNITSFLAIHLGGDTILSMLAGTDITREFEIAHGNAAKTLGMPDVFVEGTAVPMPTTLQPLTAFIYKVVRYTNAFAVTQAEVLRNNEADLYVQACGLSNALELWPETTMWGQELAEQLGIDSQRLSALTDMCTTQHKETIDFIKRCMADPDSLERWADYLACCVATYEDYGRMLTLRLCDVLRRAYAEPDGATTVAEDAAVQIHDVLGRFAASCFDTLRFGRSTHAER